MNFRNSFDIGPVKLLQGQIKYQYMFALGIKVVGPESPDYWLVAKMSDIQKHFKLLKR